MSDLALAIVLIACTGMVCYTAQRCVRMYVEHRYENADRLAAEENADGGN